MVYSSQFVAVVKCNGKVLRERSDVVTLPFGAEYSLLLKNLSPRKASVNVSIDGQDVLYGNSLIIDPNSETELKGFLDGMTVRHRFKFIQKTKQIQQHRGDKLDDGIIRIQYAFEEQRVIKRKTILHEHHKHEHHHHHHHRKTHWYNYDYYPPLFSDSKGVGWDDSGNVYGSSDQLVGSSLTCNSGGRGLEGEVSNCFYSNVCEDSLDDAPLDDEGITVQGSQTRQDFHYDTIGKLEPSQVIILRLRGQTSGGTKVSKPVTVKTKFQCPTCGTRSGSRARFCAQCGTNLEI